MSTQGKRQQVHQGHLMLGALSLVSVAFVACTVGGDKAGGDGDGDKDSETSTGGMGGQLAGSGGDAEGMGGSFQEFAPVPDEVIGPQGVAFVPEGIAFENVSEGEIQFTLVASTLLQESGIFDEVSWFGAFRNDGNTIVCVPGVAYEFFDAAGKSLAFDHEIGGIRGPMYMSYGDPGTCLGPGDIGMIEATYGLDGLNVADVARVEYAGSGALTLSAEPIEDVVFTDLALEPIYTESVQLVGKLKNGLGDTIESPRVYAFVVDPIGRPYGLMRDIELVEIAPGASWSFETLSFDEPVDSYVIYSDYRYPF